MATTSKKVSKSTKAKLRRRVVKKSPVEQLTLDRGFTQRTRRTLEHEKAAAIENERLC